MIIFSLFLSFYNTKSINYYFFFQVTPLNQEYNTILPHWWFMKHQP